MAGVDWILPWMPKSVTLCDGRGQSTLRRRNGDAAILATMKRFRLIAICQNQHQWRGKFATVTDGFLNEPGAPPGNTQCWRRPGGQDGADRGANGSIGAAIEARLTAVRRERAACGEKRARGSRR